MSQQLTVTTRIGTLAVQVDGTVPVDGARQVDGVGPVAVLWHSLFVDDRSWDRVAPQLASLRRLVRITGPGHGQSEPTTTPYTLDDCAEAAVMILDELGVAEPVDWVGNAWGGHVGIVFAAANPGRIRSLAMFNTPVPALTAGQARGPRLLARVFRVSGAVAPIVRAVTAALLSTRTRANDPAAVAYVHACLRAADRRALVTAIHSVSLGRPDLRPLSASITVPTLLVTSDADDLWTPAQADAAALLMPGATSEVAIGTGHLTPLESPDETVALVAQHWARI